MIRFGIKAPSFDAQFRRAAASERVENRAAAIYATDRASKEGQQSVQARMRLRRLARLANAVGQTSTQRSRKSRTSSDPFGVIFARGGDESRAGQALESYSRGAFITPANKNWLAFQTNALPRRIGRRRLTPELYRTMGLAQRFGPLVFRQIRPNLALLVIRKVTVSPKTGRAQPDTGRRTRSRIPQKEIVAFILIKGTARLKRFDQLVIMRGYARRVPDYMTEFRSRKA